ALAHARTVATFFRSFESAIRSGNGTWVLAHFDVPRLWREVKSWGEEFRLTPKQEADFTKGLATGITRRFRNEAPFLLWERQEILLIKLLPGGREAVVLTRDWMPGDVTRKARWWLVRSGERWKLYDLEEVDFGIRMSLGAAGVLSSMTSGKDTSWIEAQQKLLAAMKAIHDSNADLAEAILTEIDGVRFPRVIEGVRQVVLGSLRLLQGRPGDAVGNLDRAAAIHPDMPMLSLLRASAGNALGDHAVALGQARRYLELVGGEADGHLQEGIALAGLGRTSQAMAAFHRGLARNPDSLENLVELALLLPPAKSGEIGTRFAKLRDPAGSFEVLVESLVARGGLEQARTVVAALRKLSPKDPRADYYVARLLSCEGRNEEAAALLIACIPKLTDPDARGTYELGYMDVMIAANKPLEAYRALGGSSLAFHRLGYALAESADVARLERLVKAHRAKMPFDPALPLFAAEIHWLRGEYAEMVDLLEASGKGILRLAWAASAFDDRLVRGLVRLGRLDEALAAAKRATARDGNPFYEALVHAVAGREEPASRALAALVARGYRPADFYADSDLGPALRGDGLAGLRKRFPPPDRRE
ncbi:MAG: tetratricopeptide repeat protein, partial [Planctomycetota bacterium]